MSIQVEMKEGNVNTPPEPQKPEVKEVAKVVTPPTTSEPKYVRLEDLEKVNQAINNTREYNNRQLKELNEKLDRLIPKPPVTGDAELDDLVQKDWKAAVAKVTEEVLQRQDQQRRVETESQAISRILDESKQKVMDKHPDLGDPSSAKAKEFMKVLEDHPDYKTNPRGPLLAAYEMENRLNLHATVKVEETKPPVNKEVRAKASSIPSGTSPGTKQGYTLSKSDMDFCRLNGINPENYKRYRGKVEARA